MAATFDGLEKSENLFENTKAVEAASAAFSTTTLSTQMKTCRYLCHILCAMGPPPAPPSVPFTFHRMQTLSLTHSLSLCVSFPTNLLSRYSQEEREMREEDAGGGVDYKRKNCCGTSYLRLSHSPAHMFTRTHMLSLSDSFKVSPTRSLSHTFTLSISP